MKTYRTCDSVDEFQWGEHFCSWTEQIKVSLNNYFEFPAHSLSAAIRLARSRRSAVSSSSSLISYHSLPCFLRLAFFLSLEYNL